MGLVRSAGGQNKGGTNEDGDRYMGQEDIPEKKRLQTVILTMSLKVKEE